LKPRAKATASEAAMVLEGLRLAVDALALQKGTR
jgi:hypothetical protein